MIDLQRLEAAIEAAPVGKRAEAALWAMIPAPKERRCSGDCPFIYCGGCNLDLEVKCGQDRWSRQPGPLCPAWREPTMHDLEARLKEDVANVVHAEWFKCHGSSMHPEDCAALADAALAVVEGWARDFGRNLTIGSLSYQLHAVRTGITRLADAIAAERRAK